MRLFGYFRSSTSYRLRIALNLKGLPYDYVPVSLLKSEQKAADYVARDPFASVPLLEADGRDRAQSMAQLEWLDEAYPERPLLPAGIEDRYLARELAYAIATELHAPLNLPVLKYLKDPLGQPQEAADAWYRHWCDEGLSALEGELRDTRTGTYCHGDQVTMADACLVPQVFNAQRFAVDMSRYPSTMRIFDACMRLDAFQKAQPSVQPEAARAG